MQLLAKARASGHAAGYIYDACLVWGHASLGTRYEATTTSINLHFTCTSAYGSQDMRDGNLTVLQHTPYLVARG